MQFNAVVHATMLNLDHEPIPAEQSVRGKPTTATAVLGDFAGHEGGVWEMTPGVMTDTVEFADGGGALVLGPGGGHGDGVDRHRDTAHGVSELAGSRSARRRR